ncbi:hypothetical protein [Rugosimonospora acidiphila]|uniref:hypothetical protein n=1 Tax=Rugosimonospora acidiphila TaxID=556531 RepID=UPI0031E876C8
MPLANGATGFGQAPPPWPSAQTVPALTPPVGVFEAVWPMTATVFALAVSERIAAWK